MKKLEFETSKGRFVLVDNNQYNEAVIDFLKKVNYGSYMNRIKLSEITEEQASEIVGFQYMDYMSKPTAIESLKSLLKSKGIHLFVNPYKQSNKEYFNKIHFEQSEEKTFYNPYIFKL